MRETCELSLHFVSGLAMACIVAGEDAAKMGACHKQYILQHCQEVPPSQLHLSPQMVSFQVASNDSGVEHTTKS